jgi:isopentenyl-diphosphate delta-isomerase
MKRSEARNGAGGRASGADAIILVDADDLEIGVAEKVDVHRRGLRHRAISALVRNAGGDLLLQRRNLSKYHSGGLWANACCSHPRPGESPLDAARRRLMEEMGVDCPLEPLFTTHYRAAVSNGFIEDEIVHAFGGTYDGPVSPDPAEVSEWRWIALADLMVDQSAHPDVYTVWFRHYLRAHQREIADWLDRSN